MNLDQIKNVFFIGIGGIGMSALARYFTHAGKTVAGYDKTPTDLTTELQQHGIAVHFEDTLANIPESFRASDTLVVVTPAVPKSQLQWNHFLENNFTVKKRAEVLGIITRETYCFAVAGTHGKTTTSSILGHILFESGVEVTAFLGGIVENYDSNLIGNGTKVTVVEADEFDRSFLQLSPDSACITSMDADHLDIYGDSAAIEQSFTEFAHKVQDRQSLFVAKGLPLDGMTVAVNEQADFRAINISIRNGEYHFDIVTPSETLYDLRFALPGHHNLSNALMAVAMARSFGVDAAKIASALASFKGIRRRFSYQLRSAERIYIDDYAHHPTEIDAVHQAVRELYPGKKVLAVFQPHLFSRTKDFADDFAASLSRFDEILLLDIYPARELPIEGVTSAWLLGKMSNENSRLVEKDALVHAIIESAAPVVLTIGAGDIGELVPNIKRALS